MKNKSLIVVYTECGDSWTARINLSREEAEQYYLGKTFTVGFPERKVIVNRVRFIDQ